MLICTCLTKILFLGSRLKSSDSLNLKISVCLLRTRPKSVQNTAERPHIVAERRKTTPNRYRTPQNDPQSLQNAARRPPIAAECRKMTHSSLSNEYRDVGAQGGEGKAGERGARRGQREREREKQPCARDRPAGTRNAWTAAISCCCTPWWQGQIC